MTNGFALNLCKTLQIYFSGCSSMQKNDFVKDVVIRHHNSLTLLMQNKLTLKAPSKICSRRHSNFYFLEKTSLDISCESSAKQTIHMKCQDLFSLKKNLKKLLSAAVVVGTLKVKITCPFLIVSQ